MDSIPPKLDLSTDFPFLFLSVDIHIRLVLDTVSIYFIGKKRLRTCLNRFFGFNHINPIIEYFDLCVPFFIILLRNSILSYQILNYMPKYLLHRLYLFHSNFHNIP